MPAQTVNYQCPACMGPLHFSGETGKLQCDYCGSQYDPAEIEKLYEKKEDAATEAFQQAEAVPDEFSWTPEGMRAYSCPSCGAEVVCDETTAATSCPYCGNPTVVPGQLGGMLKPDYIIPFKLDKNAAISALKKYYRRKKFLPRAFSGNNHITKIQGVYVPFWLFNGTATGDIRGEANQVSTWTEGDYKITEVEEYRILREGEAQFQRIPVDGSTKMPDAHMDSIEPFDYGELTDFSTAYLPGFLAEKYDVDKNESQSRATERMEESLSGLLDNTIEGYSTHRITGKHIHFEKVGAKYALLPVWMLHTKWQNQDYLFAMNGQTGKLIGDLPVSKGKFAAWMAGISLPLMAVVTLIMYFLSI